MISWIKFQIPKFWIIMKLTTILILVSFKYLSFVWVTSKVIDRFLRFCKFLYGLLSIKYFREWKFCSTPERLFQTCILISLFVQKKKAFCINCKIEKSREAEIRRVEIYCSNCISIEKSQRNVIIEKFSVNNKIFEEFNLDFINWNIKKWNNYL